MARRWGAGDRPLAEEFLARHPQLQGRPEAALDLVYEEVCLREHHGEEVSPEALRARFPDLREQLGLLLDCHRLLEAGTSRPRFPAAGESLAGFHLLGELGRGAQGRVFLATQPALADRPVVLKLVPRGGQEHLSLARLQHTHIVPLYAAHDDPARRLRVLCMPYFGSLTLLRLLGALRALPGPCALPGQAWDGARLLEVLDRSQPATGPAPAPARGPARHFLACASRVQALCWIGACLAEGLHYAHERGLVHLDVKPSNVLLAHDGQPMLLDFHLAQPPLAPDGPPPRWLGGTPAYMAPEHRAALEAVRDGRPVSAAVDGRADLYALGALLYEALGGQLPLRPGESPPLERCRVGVGTGLSDVIQKCLAPDPCQRYPDGAALAADLRRCLLGQRLQGVRNRSLKERWARWRRRRPYAPTLLGMALLVVAAALAAGHQVADHLGRARHLLADGQGQLNQGRPAAAADSFQQGLDLAEGLPGSTDLVGALRQALRQASRQQAVAQLHLLADQVRFQYPFDALPALTLRALEEGCRSLWGQRGLIRERLGDGLPPEVDQVVGADLLDLAVLGADLRVRLVEGSARDQARRDALRTLAEAEMLFGPGVVLAHERQRHARALGVAEESGAAPPARTAWEHYALGRSLLGSGDPDRAADHLEQAVRLEPGGLWPNFYLGQCQYRRGRHQDAVAAFSVCVGAAPGTAACYFNRAMAHAALKQYEAAEADLLRALRDGVDPATAHYHLALVSEARGDRARARERVRQALEHDGRHPEALALARRLGAGSKGPDGP
jgi:serine/threonine protein kinase